jgi:hypothetical protein
MLHLDLTNNNRSRLTEQLSNRKFSKIVYFVIRSKIEVLCAEWTKSDFFKLCIIRLWTRFNLDTFCKYVLQFCTSFLIKSYLFTSVFNMPDSETNLWKFVLGISNDLASLLYLPLVSGDNYFICDTLALSIHQILLRFKE